MASDWIKIDSDLATKNEVVKMAMQLGMNRHEVCGHLIDFWSWIDRLAVDGVVVDVDAAIIDTVVGVDGFAVSLVDAKWLDITSTGIRIPNPEKHFGKSAKTRSLKSERQRRWRENKKKNGGKSVDAKETPTSRRGVDADVGVSPSTREEKRREDIYNKQQTTSLVERPTLEDFEIFLAAEFSLNKTYASQRFTKLQASQWQDGKGKPIENWQSYLRGVVAGMTVIERDQFGIGHQQHEGRNGQLMTADEIGKLHGWGDDD